MKQVQQILELLLALAGCFFGRSDPKQPVLRTLLCLTLLSMVMKQTEVTLALCGLILTLAKPPPPVPPTC